VTSTSGSINIGADSTAYVSAEGVATSVAISLAGGSVAGAEVDSEVLSSVEAYGAGTATLNAGGNINIDALSDFTASADTTGIAGGIKAVGSSDAEVIADGSTSAYLEGTVTDADDLTITATAVNTLIASAKALAGGIIVGVGDDTGAHADIAVDPEISAYFDLGSLALRGDLTITAASFGSADAFALGVNAGGATVGTSSATAIMTPEVTSFISGGTITTVRNITLDAFHKDILDIGAEVTAIASSGAVISGNGAVAFARSAADVSSAVAPNFTVTATGDVTLRSHADNKADADALVAFLGGATANGIIAVAESEGSTSAHFDGRLLSADNLVIEATGTGCQCRWGRPCRCSFRR